jgi:hypothetical protein
MKPWLLSITILSAGATFGYGGDAGAGEPSSERGALGRDGQGCLAAAEGEEGKAWATYCAGLSPASRSSRCAELQPADPTERQSWCAAEWGNRPPSHMGPWAEARTESVEPQIPRGCDDENPPPCCYSPIVIDVRGDGFDLTDGDNGVVFDIRGDGRPVRVSWTSPQPDGPSARADDVWLALDRNRNGTIDDGLELFGNVTPQPRSTAPNGFIALAEFDKAGQGGNGDSRIDAADRIFTRLRLWDDRNHNGISEPPELFTLGALGVVSLDLHYERSTITDEHGNAFRYRAKVTGARGSSVGPYAYDVFLVRGSDPTTAAACDPPPPDCVCTGRAATEHSYSGWCSDRLRRVTCHMQFNRGRVRDEQFCFDRADDLNDHLLSCRILCDDRAARNLCHQWMPPPGY